jgi:MFS family permease
MREALCTRVFWLLASAVSLRLFVTVALTTQIVPLLVWGGMAEQQAAYVVGLYSFLYILSTLSLGWIADRWRKPLACAVGLLPVTLAMAGLVVSRAAVWPILLAVGLAVAMGTASLNWALVGDLFGRRSYPTIRGLMGVGYGVMTFLSPIYAGWVHDLTASYAPVLVTFIAVALLSALAFAALPAAPPPRQLPRP